MSLSFEERKAVDYNDTYGLTSEDVLPLIVPASELIDKVTAIAKKKMDELE